MSNIEDATPFEILQGKVWSLEEKTREQAVLVANFSLMIADLSARVRALENEKMVWQ